MRALALLPIAFVAFVACGALGCDPDDCESLPSSFRLEIEVEGEKASLPVRMLLIELDVPPDRFRQTFDVGDTFADDITSVAVELDPPRTEETDMQIRVVAFPATSTTSVPLGETTSDFTIKPNGCNLFRLELDLPD